MSSAYDFVELALSIGVIELVPDGRLLKSGRLSPYFFNSGLFNTGQSMASLAEVYARMLDDANEGNELRPDIIFGPAYKGIPLAVAAAMHLSSFSSQYSHLGYAFNRKEAKNHGEGGLIIGSPLQGKRVVIIDDVITNGDSKREAVEIIRAHGGIPIGCAIAFDREERGVDESDPRSAVQRFRDDFGIPVFAAATLTDLILVLEQGPDFPGASATLPRILAYKDQYGV